jgi:preprotein translocase subunit SecG
MNTNLLNGLLISQVVISVLLVVSVILQNRAEGLGTLFGGGGEVFRTKRGLEKFLYTATIILAVVLSLMSLVIVKLTR